MPDAHSLNELMILWGIFVTLDISIPMNMCAVPLLDLLDLRLKSSTLKMEDFTEKQLNGLSNQRTLFPTVQQTECVHGCCDSPVCVC